jgi:hypothetical protein
LAQKIIELHYRKNQNNVGDLYCNPSRYFKFDNVSTGCLSRYKNFDYNNSNVILGGGGLIRKYFLKFIPEVVSKPYNNLAIWGIGHNFGWKENIWWPDWVVNNKLTGIRDYMPGYEKYYLPCVSCMHPSFDKTYKIKHDYVYFLHHHSSKYRPTKHDTVMYNDNTDFDSVIEFLGSAKTIVTDSYHGAYWGLLMGKDVRVVSWTTKFDNFKCKPTIIDKIENWRNYKPSTPYKEYLYESKHLNTEFYKRVSNTFS